MYNELETLEQLQEHINNEEAAMVYFYSDKCAPCISLRPKVHSLVTEEFPKMKLAFINAEKHPNLTARFNIFANPTLIIFFDGREYKRESKYISIPQLAKEIERPYNMIFEN